MLCRQGPSERYAPLGLSFPPLPRRDPPIHEATGGYAAPTASAGQSCSDTFPWLATPIWHWPKHIVPNDAAANYDVSRQTGLHLRDKATRNLWDVLSSGQSPLIFDPLGNGSPVLHINYQKVSRIDECQEAGSEGGLGMSIRTVYTYNILTHNSLQQKKQNQQMSRGSKTIHILKNQSWFCNNIVTWKK